MDCREYEMKDIRRMDKAFEEWLAMALKSEKPLSGPEIFEAGAVRGRKEMKAEIVNWLKGRSLPGPCNFRTLTELTNQIDKEF